MSANTEIKFRGSLSPIMSAIKIGSDLMRISIDVPRSDLQKAIGLTALEGVALKFVISVDDSPHATPAPIEKTKREKKPAKQPGPHADFWHFMFGTKKFQFDRSLWVVLDVEDSRGVKDALHQTFEVESMSDVSPDEFEAWCQRCNLEMLVSMIREGKLQPRQAISGIG